MKFRLIIISAIVIAFFSTCETDIDITGDYQKTPVIYGLLDITADTQFVLINRTFLGSVNALEAAQIEDSMLYDNVDAKIRYGTGSDDFVSLSEIEICGKSTFGAFYSPCYTVYYVPSEEIWSDWSTTGFDTSPYETLTYLLDIEADGESIQAETKISSARGNTGNGTISFPPSGANNDVNFVSLFDPGGSTYLASGLRVKWNSGLDVVKNSIKHEIKIRFHYTEVLVDNSRIDKFIEFPFTTVEQTTVNVSETFDVAEVGSVFYSEIASRVEENPEVKYREIGMIDYVLNVAGVDLTTYLNIGDPVSSVGQSRPSFSNVNDGEGVGIFSSRDEFTLTKSLYLNVDNDLREMVNGQFTQDLCFCDATGISVDFGCANSSNHCQ